MVISEKTMYLLAFSSSSYRSQLSNCQNRFFDTYRFDSLFFASRKIKQASIPHDRRRKLVIFKMKLKKFDLSYLEVLAFSEKICYNRKRAKKCGTAANSTTSYPAASYLKKTMLQTFYSPFLLPQL